MIGWFITAIVLTFLLSAKVGIHILWKSGMADLKVRIGAFHIALPMNEKHKTNKKDTSTAMAAPKRKKPQMKRWIQSVLYHWMEVLELVSRILRSPNLDLLRIHIAVGGSDPETCAIEYGRYCAVFGAVLPVMTQLFSIRKQDINVTCCFEQPKTDMIAEAEATVRVYEILALLYSGLILLTKLYRHTKISKKAVQSL